LILSRNQVEARTKLEFLDIISDIYEGSYDIQMADH